ncbi:hypothetical protein JYT61_00615, partial [bacterium AH-315-E10]|nr:hypothetical protein [bacterium AH-315-E10]
GESERTGLGFDNLIEMGCQHLQAQISLAGIGEISAIQKYAIANGLEISNGGFSYFSSQIMAMNNDAALTEILLPVVGLFREYLIDGPELKRGIFYFKNEPGVSAQIDWDKIEHDDLLGNDTMITRDDVDYDVCSV